MQNRLFFPQEALDKWLVDGKVELAGTDLTILSEGRTYKLAEAVRVTREVTGEGDPNDLVGRVKSRPFLEQLGAELFESSMLLGDNAYDVVPGWIGRPTTTFRDFLASDLRRRVVAERHEAAGHAGGEGDGVDLDDEPKTDEDLLVRTFLEDLRP